MYWHGVVDHDNVRRRTYRQFAQEGEELARIGGIIASSTLDVRAAVLWDHDSAQGHTTMPNALPSPKQQAQLAFKTLWQQNLPCGLVNAADDLAGLQLAIWPSLPLIDPQTAEKLAAFVENGGVLLLTARSAVRNRDNQIHATGPLGPLAGLMGTRVIELGKLPPARAEISLNARNVPSGPCYEILEPIDAQIQATWKALATGEEFHPACKPAITYAPRGKGAAIYVGTYLTDENRRDLLAPAIDQAGLQPLARPTEAVEVTRRVTQDGTGLRFVLNHGATQRTVSDLPGGKDLITGQACDGTLQLAPRDVAIVQED
jgi:beta-galactosidase